MRWLGFLLLILPLVPFTLLYEDVEGWAPVDAGREWAIASPQPYASLVGADVLERGGNAVDAAVAVSFALAVVLPEAGNIGGGFFALGHQADGAGEWMLDARETAPATVTEGTYLALEPGASLRGPYASGVPGSVAGLAAMHARYGSLPWKELVEPAVKLAREGYVLSEHGAGRFARFGEKLRADDEADRVFFATEPVAGAVLRQADLGDTLARLAVDPRDFYEGETARLLVEDAAAFGSPITAADLTNYEARWRAPVACDYRNHRIVSSAPPSSGGTILCETAQILSVFTLTPIGPTDTRTFHLTAQAWGQAFRDRRYLGDPDFVDTSMVDTLVSPTYGRRIGELLRLDAPGLVTEPPPVVPESMQTTHFSVVDAQGNAVSVTTTLNGAFGSGHMVKGAGFLLNNEMDDFNTRPGEANLYGLIQGDPNRPQPGKRMLSSMSPTLVFEGERLKWILGTPGGSTIPTQVWLVLMRMIDFGWNLDRSLAAPRFHYQGPPRGFFYEPGAIPVDVATELRNMGYDIGDPFRTYGNIEAIGRLPEGGWMAVSDPRGDGLPVAR